MIALISRDHLDAIVWKDSSDDDDFDSDSDENDREYNFEVSKSEEQEENVISKSGFTVRAVHLIRVLLSHHHSADLSSQSRSACAQILPHSWGDSNRPDGVD
jgi:predicted RNA-binding protein YlqC (UPF0109 family)